MNPLNMFAAGVCADQTLHDIADRRWGWAITGIIITALNLWAATW